MNCKKIVSAACRRSNKLNVTVSEFFNILFLILFYLQIKFFTFHSLMINLKIIYKYCLSIIAIFPRCISQSIDWCRSDVIKNFVQRQLRYFLFIMLLQGDEYKSNLIFSKSNGKTGAFESYVVTSYRWISETYASFELFLSICRKKGKIYCFSGITIRILAVHNNHDVKSINQLIS